MAYNTELADRLRSHLKSITKSNIEEKRMFGGLAFMINGKMCINVSGDSLMCRFDPARLPEISRRSGFRPMIMKGKSLPGYCYVDKQGLVSKMTSFIG